MNKQRRKTIQELIERIEELKSDIELVLEEEQEYFDNMPESLQYSERGEKAEEAIGALEDAVSNLEDSIDNLTTAAE